MNKPNLKIIQVFKFFYVTVTEYIKMNAIFDVMLLKSAK